MDDLVELAQGLVVLFPLGVSYAPIVVGLHRVGLAAQDLCEVGNGPLEVPDPDYALPRCK